MEADETDILWQGAYYKVCPIFHARAETSSFRSTARTRLSPDKDKIRSTSQYMPQ
jgi:hypothetical protein